MRSALVLCACAALSCHTGSANTITGAAVMTSLAVGASAANRAAGGCYAVCQQGERCNEKTGLCEALPCRGQCRADETCEEGFFGVKCLPGPALSVSSQAVPASTAPAAPAVKDKGAVKENGAGDEGAAKEKPPVPDAARP